MYNASREDLDVIGVCMAKSTEQLALELRDKAGDCWDNGKIEEGLILINQSLQRNPNDHVANNYKAMLLTDSDDPEAALPVFEHALDLAVAQNDDLNQFKIMRNHTFALSSLGRYEEALGLHLQVLKSPHATSVNHSNLANLYLDLHRYEDCLASVASALELDASNLLALQIKADCYCEMNEFRKTAVAMSEIAAIIKDDPEAIAQLRPISQEFIESSLAERLELMNAFCTTIEGAGAGVVEAVTESSAAVAEEKVTPAVIMNALCGNQDMATAQSMLDAFMANIEAQVKANAEAVARAAADAAAAALEAARATATAGAAATTTAHLADVALTVENSPHLARLQAQAEMKTKYLAEINADKATRDYFHCLQTYVNENFASFKVSRGVGVDMAAVGGIPCSGTIGGLLPAPGGTILAIFNAGIKAYQTVKAKNGFARASDLVVGISAFEKISEAVALRLTIDHRTRIMEATTSNKGILGVWNTLSATKDRVVVNNYDTAAKKLAMQDGLLLLSAMKAGCFDKDQDLSMQFVAFISDERMMSCMDGKSLVVDTSAASGDPKKKCAIMCVTDIEYDNPVLNDSELTNWLMEHGLLAPILDLTSDRPDTVCDLADLVGSDGLDGLQAWRMSLFADQS